MKAKDKAKELRDNLYNSEYCHKEHFPNNRYCDCNSMSYFQSIESAIICVDEIIKSIKRDSDFTVTYEKSKMYWSEVKRELNKLKL